MFCFAIVLAYLGLFYFVHASLYLMGSWILSEKTMDAFLDRCSFVIPSASLAGVLLLILSLCDPAISILTSSFAWPIWFGLPIPLSFGVTIFISIGIGMTFYYAEVIAARMWLKLRTGNKPLVKTWMFGETKRIVRQGQRLPISLLLCCILSEALLEEILWRGHLISYATKFLNMPLQYAIIISSLVFGINHLAYGLANVISKTLFGIILSLMYIASESLFPCILCHQAFNIMVFKIRIEWKS